MVSKTTYSSCCVLLSSIIYNSKPRSDCRTSVRGQAYLLFIKTYTALDYQRTLLPFTGSVFVLSFLLAFYFFLSFFFNFIHQINQFVIQSENKERLPAKTMSPAGNFAGQLPIYITLTGINFWTCTKEVFLFTVKMRKAMSRYKCTFRFFLFTVEIILTRPGTMWLLVSFTHHVTHKKRLDLKTHLDETI